MSDYAGIAVLKKWYRSSLLVTFSVVPQRSNMNSKLNIVTISVSLILSVAGKDMIFIPYIKFLELPSIAPSFAACYLHPLCACANC